MESHQSVVNRPETISRELNLAVFCGKPDLAITLIKSLYFRAWEGRPSFSMGDAWANANIAAGNQRLAAKQYKEALAAYQAALTLPPTLAEEGGGGTGGHTIEASYYIGLAYEGLGDMTNARTAWTNASTGNVPTAGGGRGGRGGGGRGGPGAPASAPAGAPAGGTGTAIALPTGQFGGGGGRGGSYGGSGTSVTGSASYYQAMAFQKLGQADNAKTILQQLLDASTAIANQNAVSDTATVDPARRSTIADAHYLVGLANIGLGNKDKAKQELTLALKASPDHLAAKVALANVAP
jgi:tetratricopeptide (TPR) repeat protein